MRGLERDGIELPRGSWGTSGKCNAVGGSTGYPGDAVVLQRNNVLWFPVADGATVALLSVLVVSPGMNCGSLNLSWGINSRNDACLS